LAPSSAPRASNSGTSIRSNTSFRATIEGVKCRPIENRPRQTPSSCRPSPRVEPVPMTRICHALCWMLSSGRGALSLDAQSPKVSLWSAERYFRQPQLMVVADAPRFAIRRTPPVPGPHSCRSAAAGSIFIARRAGA
jgi:hypothetical protein